MTSAISARPHDIRSVLGQISITGDADVTVSEVSLVDPRGVRIVAAYFVPISGHDLYGVRSGFPPALLA